MPSAAANDVALLRWIADEVRASRAEAKVAAETASPVNLPVPAANPDDVAAAKDLRQAANFSRRTFLVTNGVLPSYAHFPLSPASELQRVLEEASARSAPKNIVADITNAVHLARTKESGATLPGTGTDATGAAGAGASAARPSILADLGTFALLTSPVWLALLYVRTRR